MSPTSTPDPNHLANRPGRGHGRRAKALLALAGVLAVVGFGAGWVVAEQREEQRDAVSGQAQQLADCVNDPATTLDDCADQADQVEQTIEEEDGATGPAGPAGPDGSDGTDGNDAPPPTTAQVALAVQSYCSDGRCEGDAGEDGTDGTDGRSVTPGQVAAAVAEYCSSDGRCRGPAGSDGTPGDTGPAGPAGTDGRDGEQGPPPSAEQVAAAVDAYCTNGACTGPPGADGTDGADGADGAPGRGIDRLECDPDTEEFIAVFDDGERQPIAGSDCVTNSLIEP